jgi:DNA mismatch repair protein MutL
MAIKVLAQEVVQKIAAGEVIERPASVVRELVENSLDAGATQVSVTISGGGLVEIRVSDNGAGVAPGDVALAFTRHATSKISRLEDLDRLSTLGFRGEALASIAAVADVTLVSGQPGAPAGVRAHYAYGERLGVQPDSAAPGTTISARDLFANVPARRKFLRRPAAEGQQVLAVVSRYAVAHSAVAFALEVDGRPVLRTLGGGLLDAIRRVQGPEVGDQMLAFDHTDGAGRAYGYAGPPSLHRSSSRFVDVFVNGRWVQDRVLARAATEAYRSLLPTGRFPVVTLLLEVPPDRVDVNVHPAKSEVRFAEPDRAFDLAFRALRSVLAAAAPVPSLGGQHSSPAGVPQWGAHQALMSLTGWEPRQAPEADAPAQATPANLPPLRVVGQVQQTYIVAEGPDGLYLVDQHAAHERVLFERFLRERASGAALSQGLLSPLVVAVGPERCSLLAQLAPRLGELGFQAEPFGADVALVRAIPAMLPGHGQAIERALVEVLDSLATGDEERWLEHSLVRLVCHSAVRAGETLDLSLMREILRELEATASPRTCPHGRPTMLYLSANQMEREFRRR